MDLAKTIQQLREEKRKLDQAISALEALQDGTPVVTVFKRRGRKSMPAEERAKVSERMKKFWASRRK